MTGDDALTPEIEDIEAALARIEATVAEGTTSPQELEDYKAAIDTLRITVLSILTASHTGNYQGFIAKFHVRQAVSVCESILPDVIDGTVSATDAGFDEFHATIKSTLEHVSRLVQDGANASGNGAATPE